jgi:hypothetical protein
MKNIWLSIDKTDFFEPSNKLPIEGIVVDMGERRKS